MTKRNSLERIQINPRIFGGKPIMRGMRIAVEHILGMLAADDSQERILKEYPFLKPDDIRASLEFGYRLVAGEQVYQTISIVDPNCE